MDYYGLCQTFINEALRGQLTLEQLQEALVFINETLRGQLTLTQLREELAKLQTAMHTQTGKKTVTFTESGIFTPPPHVEWIDLILCGGGGGGGYQYQYRHNNSGYTTTEHGQNGEDSYFGDIVAKGGNGGRRFKGDPSGNPNAGGNYEPHTIAAWWGHDGMHRVPGKFAQQESGALANGGGSYRRGGIFNNGSYLPPGIGGGGGVDVRSLSIPGVDIVKAHGAHGGGGGETVYGRYPVNTPIEIVIGKGGTGAALGGYDGANGSCIIMY